MISIYNPLEINSTLNYSFNVEISFVWFLRIHFLNLFQYNWWQAIKKSTSCIKYQHMPSPLELNTKQQILLYIKNKTKQQQKKAFLCKEIISDLS